MIIENSEKKNELVDFDRVTVEHVMPKELKNWIIDLGGKEKANDIWTRLLNNIGNLAILSRPFNSSIKDSPWKTKKKELKGAQFFSTSEITDNFDVWDEDSILTRAKDVSDRLCNATATPLPRITPWTTDVDEVTTSGWYPITLEESAKDTKIIAVKINDKEYSCNRWKKLLNIVCDVLNNLDGVKMQELTDQNKVHKSVLVKAKGSKLKKDPLLSKNPKFLQNPVLVNATDIYYESCQSANSAIKYARLLLREFGLENKCEIELEVKEIEDDEE